MNAVGPLALALVLALAAPGCGDAGVDGGYRGEPLFALGGWVQVENLGAFVAGDAVRQGRLRMALLWAAPNGNSSRFDVVSSVAEEVDASGVFPARYSLALYTPPAASLVRAAVFGEDPVAIGVLVAFLDRDGDGRWQAGLDPLVGAVLGRAIVWAPRGASGDPFGAPLPPGFSLVTVEDDTGRCLEGGRALLTPVDADADLALTGEGVVEAALDLDCDGQALEWLAFCPPLEVVRDACEPGEGIDPGGGVDCGLCVPFLAPPGDDPAACDAWLGECLSHAPAPDCELEWRACRGEDGDPALVCGDPACLCEEVFRACLEGGGEPPECQARREVCLTF